MLKGNAAIDLEQVGKVLSVDDQLCFARPYDLSPDSTQVAFTWNASGNWEIYTVPLEGGTPRRITSGPGSKYSPRWSPDGKHIAFLTDLDGSENFDIYLVPQEGGESVGLVEWPSAVERFIQWSPDGMQIAFESNKEGNFDVWVVSPSGGDPRRLTDLETTYKVPEWSPDGRQIAFTGRGTDALADLHVFAVPVEGGEARQIIRVEEGSLDRSPSWSPDGKWIAFTSDAFGKDDIGLYSVESGETKWIMDPRWEVISPGPMFGTSNVAWSPDGTKLAYPLNRAGNVDLVVRDVETGSEAVFDTPKGQRLYPAFTGDGKRIMFVYDGPRHPPDLWVASLEDGSTRQLTESLFSEVSRESLVEPELIWYPSFDGRQISGFLYTPLRKAKGSPALLWVHGGPTWQYRNIWDPAVQFLVSRGYVVLAPNIRGSSGYGKEFRELAIRDWGGGDLKDLVAGAEYLERGGIAGRGRIGVAGASYGGYMTLVAMTKTPDRWAAGVSICGIVNLRTLYETTRGDLKLYLIQQLGTPEENPELYWDRSPFNFADDVKRPLMIVQGGTDPRVPLREAEQMASALSKRGAVLEYKVYPDEGHDLMKLENRLDCFALMADFLDKHMLE